MKKRGIVFIGIAVITVFLNILAWNSTAFSDWYIAHIFPPLGQHLRQDNGHFSFFRRGMADCSRACSSGNSTDFAGSARGRWNNKADSQENLCREVLPVCEGILSVLFLGASVRLPDYDPELLYPVPCFQLFRKIFRRKYRGADPGTVDYCLQSGGGKL